MPATFALEPASRILPLPDSAFEQFLELRVSDDGIGIPAPDLPSLFQPFQQVASAATRLHEGTGLGLALVDGLAELHGGTVGVASTLGQGTSFVVWLPWRSQVELQEGAIADLVADDAVAQDDLMFAAQAGLQALVIENQPHAAELLRIHLEGMGFQVQIATEAATAIGMATLQPPDLITLDLMLPDATGWEVLTTLKSVPVLAEIPVVIVSVVADEQKGVALGAASTLQKPVSRQTLLDTVNALGLGKSAHRASKVLVVDDDPDAVEFVAACLDKPSMTVLRAYDGHAAVELAKQTAPDLLILDLMMPGMSGFEVVDALASIPQTALTPILVLTAKSIGREERERLGGRVLQVLEKGMFSPEQFQLEINRALYRKQRG
jgi:CheY-like chemotaxis protein